MEVMPCRVPQSLLVQASSQNLPQASSQKPPKSWHYYEKQHELSMSSNLDIIYLSITSLDPWSHISKFHTNLRTHCSSNYACPSCKNKVHHPKLMASILVANRTCPAFLPLACRRLQALASDGLCWQQPAYQQPASSNKPRSFWDLSAVESKV